MQPKPYTEPKPQLHAFSGLHIKSHPHPLPIQRCSPGALAKVSMYEAPVLGRVHLCSQPSAASVPAAPAMTPNGVELSVSSACW